MTSAQVSQTPNAAGELVAKHQCESEVESLSNLNLTDAGLIGILDALDSRADSLELLETRMREVSGGIAFRVLPLTRSLGTSVMYVDALGLVGTGMCATNTCGCRHRGCPAGTGG
jgi:hypothetical protein